MLKLHLISHLLTSPPTRMLMSWRKDDVFFRTPHPCWLVHYQGSIIVRWMNASLNTQLGNPCSGIYLHQSSGLGRKAIKLQGTQNGFCELACSVYLLGSDHFWIFLNSNSKVKILHLCRKGLSGVVEIFYILIVVYTSVKTHQSFKICVLYYV